MSLEELRSLLNLLAEQQRRDHIQTRAHLMRLRARILALASAVRYLTPEEDRDVVQQALAQKEKKHLENLLLKLSLTEKNLSGEIAQVLQNWDPDHPMFQDDP